jgi:hypothetical protein
MKMHITASDCIVSGHAVKLTTLIADTSSLTTRYYVVSLVHYFDLIVE